MAEIARSQDGETFTLTPKQIARLTFRLMAPEERERAVRAYASRRRLNAVLKRDWYASGGHGGFLVSAGITPLGVTGAYAARPVTAVPAEHGRLDALAARILDSLPLNDHPLTHLFLPGLYVRQIVNPAGSLVVTKVHRTRHAFVLLRGRMTVYTPEGGANVLEAPLLGVTEPGTQRAILAHEEVTWVTFHPLSATEENMRSTGTFSEAEILAAIEGRIIERHELPDGSTLYEHYVAALASRAENGYRIARERNPGKEVPPIDYTGLLEQAGLLARGLPLQIAPEVIEESRRHMEEFGLDIEQLDREGRL